MDNFVSVLGGLISGAWGLFSINVPGFPFSYADIALGSMFAFVGLGALKALIGKVSFSSRGASTQNPKISKERQNDTK